VYTLWWPITRLFKFGYSCDPPRRSRQLGGRLVHCFPGGRADERALHERFAPFRVRGTEYFWPAGPIWEWLDEQDVDPRRFHG
jgi:hypothetical protein